MFARERQATRYYHPLHLLVHKVSLNYEQARILNEEVGAYLKTLFRNWPGETEENHAI
jgi:hypothetical protein